MKTETLKSIILEAALQCPPAIEGDARAGFVLGYLISRHLGPESGSEVFTAVFGKSINEALDEFKNIFAKPGN